MLAVAGCGRVPRAPVPPMPPDWEGALLSGKAFVAEDQAVFTFEDEVLEKFSEERFDDLEAMAKAEAANPHPLVNSETVMDVFYRAFRRDDWILQYGYRQDFFMHFAAWERARPDSPVMPMALCSTCLELAERDPQVKAQMVGRARACVAVAERRTPHDPRVPAFAMVADILGGDAPGADSEFRKVVAMNPNFFWAWNVRLQLMAIPQGSWPRLLDDAVAATRGRMGTAMYALLVAHSESRFPAGAIKSARIPWSRLRQAFLDAGKLYPGSIGLLNTFARYAWWKGDRSMSRALYAAMGDDDEIDSWSNNEYEQFKSWVRQKDPGPADTEVPADLPFAPAPVPKPQWLHPPSRATERVHFAHQVFQLMLRKQFRSLEAIVAGLRSGRPDGGIGPISLSAFYEAFSDISRSSDGQVGTLMGWLRDWQGTCPRSSAAHIALAAMNISFAWRARGNGYANTITEAGGRLFSQRLEAAATELDAADRLGPDPQAYTERLAVEEGRGDGQLAARVTIQKLLDTAPRYTPAYRVMADILLPRWYGAPGDVERFAEQSAALTHKALGDSLYAVVALEVARCEGQDFFRHTRFDWKRMVQGFRDGVRHGLCDRGEASYMCSLAQMRGDRRMLGEALQAMGADSNQWAALGALHMWEDWATHPGVAAPGTRPRAVLLHVGRFDHGLLAVLPRESTTVIPLEPLHAWGLEVRIVGFPSDPKTSRYHVRCIIRHPPFRRPDGHVETESVARDDTIGVASDPVYYQGWLFDRRQPWEWVPGRWDFRIEVDGHTVAHQHFTVKQ